MKKNVEMLVTVGAATIRVHDSEDARGLRFRLQIAVEGEGQQNLDVLITQGAYFDLQAALRAFLRAIDK